MLIPMATVVCIPMADGGEGSGDVLRDALGCDEKTIEVTGPLGELVVAKYWLSRDGKTGVVETAQANGLQLVPVDKRNPLKTTTFGCGELVKVVLQHKVERLFVTVGGSSTVDGGIGLAQALGYQLLDDKGQEVSRGGDGLGSISTIIPPVEQVWEGVEIDVLCDVTNPLLGESGAARVFAPQKGATPDMVEQLEAGLSQLAQVIRQDMGMDVTKLAGGGAAGGMGAGLAAFMGARLVAGIDVLMSLTNLQDQLESADLVVTGEGRLDSQTAGGQGLLWCCFGCK